MQNLFKDFKIEDLKQVKKISKRSDLLSQFLEEINKERPCFYIKNGKKKKLGLVKGSEVAFRLSHIKNLEELRYFLSECKDYRNRNGSFNKRFFGSLKVKD